MRKFLQYYRPYKRLFLLDFGCAIIAAVLELAFPVAVNKVVDELLPNGNWQYITWACAGLLAIYLLSALLHYIVTYWGHKLGVLIETDMRKTLFESLQRQSFRFFDRNKTGQLVSRMTNDLLDIGEMAHHGPEDLFVALMTLCGAFLLMLSINVKLAVLTFIIVPGIVWLSLYFSRKMSRAFSRMFSSIGDFNARVENNIGGIRVVQAFGNEDFEIAQFQQDNKRFRDTKFDAYQVMAWNASISYILMKVISIFVLLCGTWFVINGKMTYGEFIAFVILSNIFLGPIQQINAVIEMYPKGIAGFKRYLELLEQEPEIKDASDAVALQHVKGAIVFDHVDFGYEANKQILQNVSFDVQAGETIALVGPSGAGKTTICSLLPRFYDIQQGSITIDGLDIRNVTLATLRDQIGIVQQDVFLFDGTIRENIAYGKLSATEDEIWKAVEMAQLKEFVCNEKDGLDTVIGERGVKLSGGQKQRLSIARLFLKDPAILILDEATSALDTETETLIQQALANLSVGRTTLVIAHRLATIKEANRILVVTKAGVEETGTHERLLEQKGIYYRLYTAQFGY